MKVIYCAGEQAKVVLDILNKKGEDKDIVLLDDNPKYHGETIRKFDIIGGKNKLSSLDPNKDKFTIAYGANQGIRLDLAERLQEEGFSLFNVVHPDTDISETASIGEGIIINSLSYIGPDVIIEDITLIDSLVNISHDSYIGKGTIIGPNATIAGNTNIGKDVYIGANATIIDHIDVGDECLIGAGSVVINDIPSGTKVVGVPAEKKK